MDSLAWLRRADAGSANLKGGMPPAAIGKANAPASKTSNSKFDSLRGKMAAYFIAPGNLGFLNELGNVCEPFSWEVRFLLGEWKGDRSIGKANLRKGATLQWPAHLAPCAGCAA